ncbi:uncharacterized protein KD926_002725 [Aspergillus affinis]|uniref:uncharacterized protein n=1 Tax=Aspergillus affinis TaxID=1070780 RepID=UPI0022FF36C8|nr:uncharacterized protein KD926_002725 [Aspergillus affinis]KAI9043835.1 hypothetical protein KD926_002725 [Aspergillus affinis]
MLTAVRGTSPGLAHDPAGAEAGTLRAPGCSVAHPPEVPPGAEPDGGAAPAVRAFSGGGGSGDSVCVGNYPSSSRPISVGFEYRSDLGLLRLLRHLRRGRDQNLV